MPEVRECYVHYQHARYILVETFGLGTDDDKGINWTLRGLWADATNKESGWEKGEQGSRKKKLRVAPGFTTLHTQGYVDKITANCKAARGQQAHQTRIWPPSLHSSDGSGEHASAALRSLVLEGISYTPQSLILKFKDLDLQISWLVHSSPQFFSPLEWNGFQRVHRANRAKVALALEFDCTVMAVLPLDLLIQFRWGQPGAFQINNNILENFDGFVRTVCKWVKIKILPCAGGYAYIGDDTNDFGNQNVVLEKLATAVIKQWGEVFRGFGAYSVQEVVFCAGLSPYLTAFEVFTNPSRLARLLLAMRQFADFDASELWKDVVKPAFHGKNILAPTTHHQLRYSNYLSVYAKDMVVVSENMGILIRKFHDVVTGWLQDNNEVVRGIGSFWDPFDPSLIGNALADPTHGFKNVVFGWDTMGGTLGSDIISEIFIAAGKEQLLCGASTFLDLQLSSPNNTPSGKKTQIDNRYYPSGVWTPLLCFPENTQPEDFVPGTKIFFPGVGRKDQDKQKRLFKTIVRKAANTSAKRAMVSTEFITMKSRGKAVSIGPLEYCGNGIPLKNTNGKIVVASCALDDTIDEHLMKILHGLCPDLKHNNLQIEGPDYDLIQEDAIDEVDDVDDEDEPLDPDGAGADTVFGKVCSGDDESEGEQEDGDGDDGDESGNDEHPRKRMRMSADAAIALAGLGGGLLSTGRISRSTSASHCSPSRSSSVGSSRSKMSTS